PAGRGGGPAHGERGAGEDDGNRTPRRDVGLRAARRPRSPRTDPGDPVGLKDARGTVGSVLPARRMGVPMGSATIPTGYTVRPAAWGDLGDVARMLRTIDIHDTGHPDMGESELASDWRHPGLVLATDTWLVFDADGNLTAYAWLLPRDGHVRLNGWGAVHPDHRGRGIGTLLLDLSEGRAVEHRAEAPPERDVEIEIGTMAPDHDVRAMLETRGFRNVRQFWRMEIALEPGMTAGPDLDGVAIRSFVRRTDDRAVHAVLTESFEGQWGFVARPFDEWAAHRLDDPDHDPSVWFVANEGDELVGALVGAT